MPRRPQPEDDFTDADREAIAAIRRELDAEFGPLEPAEPLELERSRSPARPSPPRPEPARPSAPRAPVSRPRPRAGARAAPLFLLGALVGGAAGGVTGGVTALLWLQHAEGPVTEEAAVEPTHEPRADGAIESAVNEWLAATKAGDIERQMRFYPARVPVYYTWRDATRQAVRAEKVRVFGAATRLQITTDTPTIEVAHDGDSAVSRFRKRYVIEGPKVRRRGEVLQEIRWTRTPDGWRIVAERDAEVLSPSASVGADASKRGGTIDPAR